MAKIIILSVYFLFNIFSTLPSLGNAISSCNGPCRDLNDYSGLLICINGKCNDDPDIGSHVFSNPPLSRVSYPLAPSGTCRPSGSLLCGGVLYPKFYCSPPVTSSTSAKLTNDFSEGGGSGGAPLDCDERYYANTERVVALSTGWYSRGSRCGQMIRITSRRNGRSTTARVVDECDSKLGCDQEHAYQPPCKNNIVDGSNAVWNALGLNTNVGVEDITWSMV